MQIKGFNADEQLVFDVIQDRQPHTIVELSLLFVDKAAALLDARKVIVDVSTINSVAQSIVRNSLRRLRRDFWVDGPAEDDRLPKGTYRLSRAGKDKIKRGTDHTASYKQPEPVVFDDPQSVVQSTEVTEKAA